MFINNDPSILAGCVIDNNSGNVTYDVVPMFMPNEEVLTQENYETHREKIAMNSGRYAYHDRPHHRNRFITEETEEKNLPTIGVELETIVKTNKRTELNQLRSNWFHFERDGSLGDNGYELITEALPHEIYSDPGTWAGLQALMTPLAESWRHRCCGLHVHVGLQNIARFQEKYFPFLIGVDGPSKTRLVKCAAHYLYYNLFPRSITDNVFMRRENSYCSGGSIPDNNQTKRKLINQRGDLIAQDLFLLVISDATDLDAECAALTRIDNQIRGDNAYVSRGQGLSTALPIINCPPGASNHSVEVNASHPLTIEFRRGKGTLNHVSVLCMVEFARCLVQYTGHLAMNPGEIVTKDNAYQFIINNTTSEKLKIILNNSLTKEQ